MILYRYHSYSPLPFLPPLPLLPPFFNILSLKPLTLIINTLHPITYVHLPHPHHTHSIYFFLFIQTQAATQIQQRLVRQGMGALRTVLHKILVTLRGSSPCPTSIPRAIRAQERCDMVDEPPSSWFGIYPLLRCNQDGLDE